MIGIFVVYIVSYHDVLFTPSLLGGIDVQIPWSTHRYFEIGVWTERNLGYVFSDFFYYNNIFTGIISILSGGNFVFAQKLFFLGIPFAGVTSYYFIKNHVTENRMAASLGAIFYMFAPYTIQNYGTGLIWELAFVPLSLHFGLHFLLSNRRQIRNLLLFNVFYSLAIGFGVHALLGIPITLALMFLIKIMTGASTFYVKRILALTILGIGIFSAMNPGVITMFITYLGINNSSDITGAHAIPVVTVEEIFANYSLESPIDIVTTANWSHITYFSSGGIMLFLVSLIGLMQLPKKDLRVVIYGSATTLAFFVLYGLMIYTKSDVFPLIYSIFSFLALFRGTEGIAPFILISSAILLSYSLTILLGYLNKSKRSRRQYSAITLSAILLIQFAYSPAFSHSQHVLAQHYGIERGPEPVPYPSIYQEIVDWLRARPDYSMYRAILLPTSFLSTLYIPYEYQLLLSPTNGHPNTNSFVEDLQNSLLSGSTDWGREIAPASVKYIVVPLTSDEPNITAATVQDNPRMWHGLGLMMNGKPSSFIEMLEKQNHLKLIHNSSSFLVYENPIAVPRIFSYDQPIVLITDNLGFTEWGRIVTQTGSVPLVYKSEHEVPYEFEDSMYFSATDYARPSSLTDESYKSGTTFLARVTQENSLLAVMISNTEHVNVERTFNILVDGENKITRTVEVPARKTIILMFEHNALEIKDKSTVYIADVPLRKISNILRWDSSLISPAGESKQSDILLDFTNLEGESLPQSASNHHIVSITQYSSSRYIIRTNSTAPFYIFLGESYSPNWNAFVGGRMLNHHEAPFGNIFYVDEVGEVTVRLEYLDSQSYIMTTGIIVFVTLFSIAVLDKLLSRHVNSLLRLFQSFRIK